LYIKRIKKLIEILIILKELNQMLLKSLSKRKTAWFTVFLLTISFLFLISYTESYSSVISFGKRVYTKVDVKSSACVGCSACVEVCPVKAIKIVNGKALIDTESCIGCIQCLKTCNYDALYRKSDGGGKK
jgi:ferredoxin